MQFLGSFLVCLYVVVNSKARLRAPGPVHVHHSINIELSSLQYPARETNAYLQSRRTAYTYKDDANTRMDERRKIMRDAEKSSDISDGGKQLWSDDGDIDDSSSD
jgi:hypothetical protein